MKCDDCKLATWKRTSSGRLHPDKSGRCGWIAPVVILPPSFYTPGGGVLCGGYIERGKEIGDCVHKQFGANPKKWRTE